MNHLPCLLPWVRVSIPIRSITSTTWGHEAWPPDQADSSSRPRDAPADCAGWVVELTMAAGLPE
jgi:hypothetical protein